MCPLPGASSPEPSQLKGPGNSLSYPIAEHPLESVCIDVFSMPALTVKDLGTKGSTPTPFDAILMCVDRHSGYIVGGLTTKEGLTGQRAAKLLYCNWFTVLTPPGEVIFEKRQCLCDLLVHKAESLD